jgi:hypothetical protein
LQGGLNDNDGSGGVTLAGMVQGFRTLITGGAGADKLAIYPESATALIVDGGGGSDYYLIGFGGLNGGVRLSDSGTSGIDTAAFAGTDGDDTLAVLPSTVFTGTQAVTYSGVERVSVYGKGGNDTINVGVTSTSNFLPLTVDGGTGSDSVHVFDTQGGAVVHLGAKGAGAGDISIYYGFPTGAANNVISYQNVEVADSNVPPQISYIRALFYEDLSRAPAVAEEQGWLTTLQTQGALAVTKGIAHSTEGQSHLVTGWFTTYAKRAPLPGEVNPWVNLLQAGVPQETVLAKFLGSTTYFINGDNGLYLQHLFVDLLGRAASQQEYQGFLAAIANVGRSGVASVLLNSAEYRSRALNAEFLQLFGRLPTPTEANAYVFSGLSFDVLDATFKTSGEYFNRVT